MFETGGRFCPSRPSGAAVWHKGLPSLSCEIASTLRICFYPGNWDLAFAKDASRRPRGALCWSPGSKNCSHFDWLCAITLRPSMRLRAQVIPALEAPWCTTLALVGNNPRVDVPDYVSSAGYPLPPRFKLSRCLQRQSALVNRGRAVGLISLSATCRAPIIVSRAYTGVPTDELFVTVEATFPALGGLEFRESELSLIGGHVIRVRRPVAPDTAPTCFSIQRWACGLSQVEFVFPATGIRSCLNSTLSSNQFLNSRPDTTLFCDWQVVLSVVQEAYCTFPKGLGQFAFRSLPRLPCFFSRQHCVYREDLLVPQDLEFRTFVVDTAREYIAWTEVPVNIFNDDTCRIPVADLTQPGSKDPSLIPPPRFPEISGSSTSSWRADYEPKKAW
jgi:hypothetical protein